MRAMLAWAECTPGRGHGGLSRRLRGGATRRFHYWVAALRSQRRGRLADGDQTECQITSCGNLEQNLRMTLGDL